MRFGEQVICCRTWSWSKKHCEDLWTWELRRQPTDLEDNISSSKRSAPALLEPPYRIQQRGSECLEPWMSKKNEVGGADGTMRLGCHCWISGSFHFYFSLSAHLRRFRCCRWLDLGEVNKRIVKLWRIFQPWGISKFWPTMKYSPPGFKITICDNLVAKEISQSKK